MLNVRTFAFAGPMADAPPITEDELHIWAIPLDAHASECVDTLGSEERSRASRLRAGEVRSRFVARRRALREILAAYTGLAPASITYSQNDYGKPAIACDGMVSFSTSHSGSLGVVAVRRRGSIGVDVERVRADAADEAIAKRFFAPEEAAALARMEPHERRGGFFNAWTRKEAIVKAVGSGLSIPLHAFEVTVRPDVPAAILRWTIPGIAAQGWQLHHFEPRPGYVGAVAFRTD